MTNLPKPRRRSLAAARVTGGLMLVSLALAGCTDGGARTSAATAPAAPPEAGVVTLRAQPVSLASNMAGRVVAFQTAEIRPQVGGIVRERVFKEGSKVEAGDVLYRIDARPYEAAVAAAEATLVKAQAALPSLQARAERYADLSSSSVVSQQDREDAQSAFLQTKADIAVAEAALETARINLGYTDIRAPIAGIIGTSGVNAGSLVTAGQTEVLATVRQLDPVYVDLTETSGNLLRHKAALQSGEIRSAFGNAAAPPEVTLSLADGTAYGETGRLEARERFVSETTSTFTVRSRFANPDLDLMPGMYVRASLRIGIDEKGILVPQRAVTRNGKGEPTAYFVKADGTAEQRVLAVASDIGSNWLVTKGAADGDRVVVDGFQKIQAGKPLRAVEVTLDGEGVVQPLGAGAEVAAVAATSAAPAANGAAGSATAAEAR